jgi:hypothetical protein
LCSTLFQGAQARWSLPKSWGDCRWASSYLKTIRGEGASDWRLSAQATRWLVRPIRFKVRRLRTHLKQSGWDLAGLADSKRSTLTLPRVERISHILRNVERSLFSASFK